MPPIVSPVSSLSAASGPSASSASCLKSSTALRADAELVALGACAPICTYLCPSPSCWPGNHFSPQQPLLPDARSACKRSSVTGQVERLATAFQLECWIGRVAQHDVEIEKYFRPIYPLLASRMLLVHTVPHEFERLFDARTPMLEGAFLSDEWHQAVTLAFASVADSHELRNRVVHDYWLQQAGTDPSGRVSASFLRKAIVPTGTIADLTTSRVSRRR